MRYLLMIFSEESDPSQVTPEQWGQVMQEYNEYTQLLRDRGAYVGGEALQDSSTATKVTRREGQTLTTDGPFIESKEQFGGYYLVEAKDLDEAIEFAAACPGAKYGTMEVRPIMDFGNAAAAGDTAVPASASA